MFGKQWFDDARHVRRPRATRLRVEALEGRALPAVFTVVNTNDSGPGSLRQVILDANAAPGADTIAFAIPGTGLHSIQPQSALPKVTGPVVIDGYTQPGSRPNTNGPGLDINAVLTVQVDGIQALGHGISGLILTAGGSTVRGLSIVNFRANAMDLFGGGDVIEGNNIQGGVGVQTGTGNRVGGTDPAARNVISSLTFFSDDNLFVGNLAGSVGVAGAHNRIGGTTPAERNVIAGGRPALDIGGGNNVVQGNYIGTDVTGTRAAGITRRAGIFLEYTATGNLIGGTGPGEGNVISGCERGVYVTGSGNVIQGNLIGTNAAGTAPLGNAGEGVLITAYPEAATNNLIGGTAPGARNVIAANGSGVTIQAAGNRVQGNLIGVLADGHTPAGNAVDGVNLTGIPAQNNLIGGTEPGAGNVIAYTTGIRGYPSADGAGVVVAAVQGYVPRGNAILGNAIFANAGLGIELTNDPNVRGVTPNDPRDPDDGANNLQNFPVLQSATSGGGTTTVKGTLNSTPGRAFRVEFFASPSADPSGYGEGARFLGTATVTTNATGTASFTARLPVAVAAGQVVTATATDPANNTSEFSKAVRVAAAAGSARPATAAATTSPAWLLPAGRSNAADPNLHLGNGSAAQGGRHEPPAPAATSRATDVPGWLSSRPSEPDNVVPGPGTPSQFGKHPRQRPSGTWLITPEVQIVEDVM
jgi:parallel beta-helix repeat protein